MEAPASRLLSPHRNNHAQKPLPRPIHFLTATVNYWLPLFTRPETVDIILDSWRFLQRDTNFQIYGYVILENHPHLIAASDNLSHDMQRLKSYTSRTWNNVARLNCWSCWRFFNAPISRKRPIRFGKKAIIRKSSNLRLLCDRSWTTFITIRSSVAM